MALFAAAADLEMPAFTAARVLPKEALATGLSQRYGQALCDKLLFLFFSCMVEAHTDFGPETDLWLLDAFI